MTDADDTISSVDRLKMIARCAEVALGQESPLSRQHALQEISKIALLGAVQKSPVSDAVSAEGERCAKIAEQYDNYTVDGRPSCTGAVIAAAIRSTLPSG